jgi:hypothetical protein
VIRFFILSLALLAFSLGQALGAVIYTQISVRKNPDGSVPFDQVRVGDWMLAESAGAHKSYEFDVDGDGAIDFGLYSTLDRTDSGTTASGVYAAPYGSVQILGAPYPPPYADPATRAVGMPAGSIIGADSPSLYSPATGVLWAGADHRNGTYTMLSALFDSGQSGTFYGGSEDVVGYLAFRILLDGGWHYGWLEANGGALGLEIFGIAWETEPNKAITAGLIPEPSSTLLFLGGLTWLAARRKRDWTA